MSAKLGLSSAGYLARQWDLIALKREEQIQSGIDHSANEVLAPAILSRLTAKKNVLDVGCGTGWLSARAARVSKSIVGIDPSVTSIEIARRFHGDSRCDYFVNSVEEFSRRDVRFEAAFANMSVSSSPNIGAFFNASRNLLKANSDFIITLPHPCFWPFYWGYVKEPWFDYEKEMPIESEFRISQQRTELKTTHFHRPLAMYVSTIQEARFKISELTELRGAGFDLPRFLLIKAVAI